MQPLTDQGWKGSDNLHADVELAEGVLRNASNLDFTASGKVRLRPGFVSLRPGSAGDGFAFGKHLVFLSGGALVAFNIETGVSTTLFPVQGARVGRAVVGDTLFVSDGVSKWSVASDLTVSAWPAPAADDPTFDSRFLAPFPAATKLCYFNGRMFGAIGNVVVYSEPYAFGVYNPTRNYFTVPASVAVLHANFDALFVGADSLYAVAEVGTGAMSIDTALGIRIADVVPAFDDETGNSFFPTARGLVVIPARGAEVSLLGSGVFAVRQMASAAAGVIKRSGVTQVVTTAVPDSSSMAEHPLVSPDYLRSEDVRKELQNAL